MAQRGGQSHGKPDTFPSHEGHNQPETEHPPGEGQVLTTSGDLGEPAPSSYPAFSCWLHRAWAAWDPVPSKINQPGS